jgi:hypothetical protein
MRRKEEYLFQIVELHLGEEYGKTKFVNYAKQVLPPPITYYWTGLLILYPSYLVGNLTNSKIAETKALEPLKS